MKNLSRIFLITCVALFARIANAEEDSEQILVSVNRINSAEQSHTKHVQITFTVHEPATVRSSQFITTTESKDRAKMRSKYPISGLFTMTIPVEFFKKLKIQKEETLRYSETAMDSGIDPQRISHATLVPDLNFTIFEESMKPYSTKPNN